MFIRGLIVFQKPSALTIHRQTSSSWSQPEPVDLAEMLGGAVTVCCNNVFDELSIPFGSDAIVGGVGVSLG